MNKVRSFSQSKKLKGKSPLPQVENRSFKKKTASDIPGLTNPYELKRNVLRELKEKQDQYSRNVAKLIPLAEKKQSDMNLNNVIKEMHVDIEADLALKKQKNYDLFVRKKNIGKRYLKENQVKLLNSSMVQKARDVLKSISKDKTGYDASREENELLSRKKTLLAMNHLHHQIEKNTPKMMNKEKWDTTLKTIQEVDSGMDGFSGTNIEPLKTSIFLKLSLLNKVLEGEESS